MARLPLQAPTTVVEGLRIAEPIENNPYVANPEKRAAMVRRQVLESSIFEGAIHLTGKDLPLLPKAPASKPCPYPHL